VATLKEGKKKNPHILKTMGLKALRYIRPQKPKSKMAI
jgi:hypothetical protein